MNDVAIADSLVTPVRRNAPLTLALFRWLPIALPLVLLLLISPAFVKAQDNDFLGEIAQLVPKDAMLVATIKPSALKAVGVDKIAGQELLANVSLPIEGIESITGCLSPNHRSIEPNYAVILRTHNQLNVQALVNWLCPGAMEQSVKGVQIFLSPSPQMPQIIVLDPKTVVFASGFTSPSQFIQASQPQAKPKAKSQNVLAKELAEADPKSQIGLAVDYEKLILFLLGNSPAESGLLLLDQLRQFESFHHQRINLSIDFQRQDGLKLTIHDPSHSLLEQLKNPRSFTEQVVPIDLIRSQLSTSSLKTLERPWNSLLTIAQSLNLAQEQGKVALISSKLPIPSGVVLLQKDITTLIAATLANADSLSKVRRDLMQLGLALHNYHLANGKLPTNILDDSGRPLLSWRVRLLPYLEHEALYRQFALDEPWDSKTNKPLLAQMPSLFRSRDALVPATNLTPYQRPICDGCAATSASKFDDISDGLSTTLAIAEFPKLVPWTKPDDFSLDGWQPKSDSRPLMAATYDGGLQTLPSNISVTDIKATSIGNDGKSSIKKPSNEDVQPVDEQIQLSDSQTIALLEGIDWTKPDRLKTLLQVASNGKQFYHASGERVLELLKPGLASSNYLVRFLTLKAIESWARGSKLPVADLLPCAIDDNSAIRRTAQIILARSNDNRALDSLFQISAKHDLLDELVETLMENRELVTYPLAGLLRNAKAELDEDLKGMICFGAMLMPRASDRQVILDLCKDDKKEIADYAEHVRERLFSNPGPFATELQKNQSNYLSALRKFGFVSVSDEKIVGFQLDKEQLDFGLEVFLTESDLLEIVSNKSFEMIDIHHHPMVSDAVVEKISENQNLTSLNLAYCQGVSSKGFLPLRQLSKLKSLDLRHVSLTDEDCAQILTNMPNLETIDLHDTDIGDKTLAKLAGLKKLRSVGIGSTLITDQGLQALKNHPSIIEFYTSGTGLSDRSLEVILSWPKLKRGNFNWTAISKAGQARLAEERPRLYSAPVG